MRTSASWSVRGLSHILPASRVLRSSIRCSSTLSFSRGTSESTSAFPEPLVASTNSERKKQRTHKMIVRVAHELFAERGYHGTTLSDIAEAAEVSRGTIFAYSPSKEDILFSDLTQAKDALARALTGRRGRTRSRPCTTSSSLLISCRCASSSFSSVSAKILSSGAACERGEPRSRRSRLGGSHDLGAPLDDPRTRLVTVSLTATFNLLSDQGPSKTRLWTAKEIAARADQSSPSSAAASMPSNSHMRTVGLDQARSTSSVRRMISATLNASPRIAVQGACYLIDRDRSRPHW